MDRLGRITFSATCVVSILIASVRAAQRPIMRPVQTVFGLTDFPGEFRPTPITLPPSRATLEATTTRFLATTTPFSSHQLRRPNAGRRSRIFTTTTTSTTTTNQPSPNIDNPFPVFVSKNATSKEARSDETWEIAERVPLLQPPIHLVPSRLATSRLAPVTSATSQLASPNSVSHLALAIDKAMQDANANGALAQFMPQLANFFGVSNELADREGRDSGLRNDGLNCQTRKEVRQTPVNLTNAGSSLLKILQFLSNFRQRNFSLKTSDEN